MNNRNPTTERGQEGDGAAVLRLLLNADQACEALSVSRKTLYLLTQPRGPIPSVKIGAQGVRWSVAAIERWIASQEQQEVAGVTQ